MHLKIIRFITAILYILAIIFGALYLIKRNNIYKILWSIFFGGASILLLVVSIISLKYRR